MRIGELWRSLLCKILGTIFSFDSCVTTALLYDWYQIIMWTFLLILSVLSAGLICRRGMSSNPLNVPFLCVGCSMASLVGSLL